MRRFLADPFARQLIVVDIVVGLAVLSASLAFIHPPTISTVVTLPFLCITTLNIAVTVYWMTRS